MFIDWEGASGEGGRCRLVSDPSSWLPVVFKGNIWGECCREHDLPVGGEATGWCFMSLDLQPSGSNQLGLRSGGQLVVTILHLGAGWGGGVLVPAELLRGLCH